LSEKPALVVVGHGTTDESGAAEFRGFVDRVRNRADGLGVGGGFIELSAPPLADAVAGLVERGHRRFVAVPLVLVAAGHAKGDIPGGLARERERHRGISVAYGRPLGPHPTLLGLLEERLDAVLDPADRAETAVLLVGRGSTDPDANAEVHKVARLFWEGRGFAFVETAFVSLAWPGVTDGLERCRLLGAKRVVVLPYFLFPGVLPDRVAAQAGDYSAVNPDVEVRCADLLGDTDELAALVLERYREALDGDIRMNCDTCVHRVAMPGFEHRVGEPQTPHDHPHDSHGRLVASDQPWPIGHASSDARGDRYDLRHHGDAEVGDGLVDLAVNVRRAAPPPWLRDRLAAALRDLAAYPRPERARAAVAARHRRPTCEVLLTAGAAEAFVLIARALTPRRAVVVHPQFTEPEAALRGAGHRVERVLLDTAGGFVLDPALVPADADLVMVGNPTNPTSVLHPADTLAALARPGRVLVVDEAFMDAVPGEPESLAAPADVPGLVVVRSLTKTWALAGLRVGYVLAAAELVERLAGAQPLWAVSTPALAALEACTTAAAQAEADAAARAVTADRSYLLSRLRELGVEAAGEPRAPFVLVHLPAGDEVRRALRERGFAVRRGDTFPGLDEDCLRVAVRDPATTDAFVDALGAVL